MTNLDKLVLRGSAIRTRLSELGGDAELTDESRFEIDALRNEYGDVERRSQALMISEDAPKIETHDASRVELEDRSSVGEIFAATLEHRGTTGATAELQTELGVQSNQVPLSLLDGDLEFRAVTPAPDNVGTGQSEIIPAVFPASAASFLGVYMPTVGVGESVFPILTTSATVHTPAENALAADTTGAFSSEVLTPSRLQAAFFFSREDRARFAGMDSALRMNLSEALSDQLDKEILQGTEGIFTGTNLSDNAAGSSATTFAEYISRFAYARVDGKYATDTSDLRLLLGSETYAHMGTAYRHQNADDLALARLQSITGGVRVSAHVPAAASNLQNGVIRLGLRRDMVAAIWEGVTLIPDEITKAANGQVVVTAIMLHGIQILRSAGFYKQSTRHA